MSTETQTSKIEDERSAVVGVVRQFSEAFGRFDVDALIGLWDDSARRIVYLPEELREPIFDLKALRAYFENVPNVVRRMHDVKVIDFELDVDREVATVFVRFWARIAFAKVPETVDGQIRQSFVLRKRDAGWKLVHYHESRQAAGFERAVGDW
jgi:ketosteroid isomerase-like protein